MLPVNEIFSFANMIEFKEGSFAKKVAVDDGQTKVFVVSIDHGVLPEHEAPLNAIVYALEGSAVITCEGREYPIHAGESFTFKKGQLHSVASDNKYKMVLFLTADQL